MDSLTEALFFGGMVTAYLMACSKGSCEGQHIDTFGARFSQNLGTLVGGGAGGQDIVNQKDVFQGALMGGVL